MDSGTLARGSVAIHGKDWWPGPAGSDGGSEN